MANATTSPLVYLKRQLGFTTGEYGSLSQEDKDDLKRWAEEEMRVLGLIE
jgi:hypothetical protein